MILISELEIDDLTQKVSRGGLFNSRQALQSWQTGDQCQIHSQQSDWHDFFVTAFAMLAYIRSNLWEWSDFLTISNTDLASCWALSSVSLNIIFRFLTYCRPDRIICTLKIAESAVFFQTCNTLSKSNCSNVNFFLYRKTIFKHLSASG